MKSVEARAFLSRSFKAEFAETVSKVQKICAALDIETVCVDRVGSTPPAAEAIAMINDVDFLIALCGRESKAEGKDKYFTSQSVRDEITMAATAKKPILCFIEDGVELAGFSGSMFTYKKLEQFKSITDEDLFQIVNGVHDEKLKSIDRMDTIPYATGITNYYITKSEMQIELKKTDSGFIWDYIIERKYVFEDDHRTPIIHAAFCIDNISGCELPPVYSIDIEKNGSKANVEIDIVEEGCGKIELHSTTLPYPTKGDTILVREHYQSPFLNITHGGQTARRPLKIGECLLQAYDGSFIINRVEKLIVRLKVPSGYSLSDVQPVVSTFSTRLDHLNESEMKRLREAASLKVDNFFGTQVYELRVDRPLYQYFYGLGWDVPKIGEVGFDLAPECRDWQ
ncbi:MAG: hypothetical protein HEQ22_15085 [Sphingopyxis sp.]|uniref:hypothetical protein n=1 Tax=Sphingopyxis sp. TaxID=1908224 RepID=UPI003D80B06F